MLQQPLPLYKTADKTFSDFIAGENAQAINAVENWSCGRGAWFILLWGEAGVGKSHLVQAALRECAADGKQTMFLPLKSIVEIGPEILSELGGLDAVGIDDIEHIVGINGWENALFSLFNSLMENHARLIVSSNRNPRFGNYTLADLQSRLCSGLTYYLSDLTDEQKKQYLLRRAAKGDMAMPQQVANFIVTHYGRNMHELSALFEKLDIASLSAGRQISIPLVKEVIAAQSSTGDT
ncbi:MAG: DnaA regulatory inactivator Hda [Gammaproteobacteria bacterium]